MEESILKEASTTRLPGFFHWLPEKYRLFLLAVSWLWLVALLLVIFYFSIPTIERKPSSSTAAATLPILFEVPPFTLTNQTGQVTSSTNLLGQVWVVDTIFTRCEGPCPRMSQSLSEIQASLPMPAPVKLVSLTTDPEYDTPAVLQAYGSHYGATADRWWFLTGDKKSLAHLAVDGLKFAVVEKGMERTRPEDLFIHSTFFVLVDQQCRARGIYHYGDRDMKHRLLHDIHQLLAER